MGQPEMSAADRVVGLATKLWRAMEYALPNLPEPTQIVLKTRLEDGDVRWALALVLAGWRLADKSEAGAPEVEGVMKETGAQPLVQQITSLQMLLPEGFTKFVNAAKDSTADHQLAGAGAYLSEAVKDLGDTPRNALHGWLKGVQFQESGRALIRRFPVPGSGRPPVWGSPPAPSSTPTPAKPARGDRFDRADFTPRQPQSPIQPTKMASAATPPRPPSPVLDGESVSRAYLFTVGWEGAEVERLLSGPSGSGKKSSA